MIRIDIDMPKNCLECMFVQDNEDGGESCVFTNVMCLSVGRQDACPLIEMDKHNFEAGEYLLKKHSEEFLREQEARWELHEALMKYVKEEGLW